MQIYFSIVMELENVFLLFNVYTFHDFPFCLHFSMGKYKAIAVIAEFLS